MILATQYYRPPFPDRKYWKDDLDLMKKSGLNALQLWALWGWIEPEPGIFRFDDYDDLFEEARIRGLNIIISSLGEIQPYWIHREIPDSYMIDHMGNRVISSNRGECNHGLTPGGCTDNPEVLRRMGIFLAKLAERYKDHESFIGWDCWNELRWNINADNLVCFCPHTLNAFREWLKEKYGGLEGLNDAWKRRYCSFDYVMPGKLPNRPYTEMMEFEAFIQARAAKHMKFRYDIIKRIDPSHIISAHGAAPSMQMPGNKEHHAMNRGNDWDLADNLDGIGCSHFPFWRGKISDADYGVRVEAIRSAAQGKTVWVSELQGGSARSGFSVFPSVRAKPQQRWVWNGFGRGAKAVIFWCWRDEVFTSEASGFGLIGMDGFAEERLIAMKETGDFLRKHEKLLDGYKPDNATIGVMFNPDTYNLEWAQDGCSIRSMQSLVGYLTALERINIPYDVLESGHLDINLDNYKLIMMPFPLVVPPAAAEKLEQFVKNGGTLLVEGECDAYSTQGFYKYPGAERDFATALGIKYIGRRHIEDETSCFELNLEGNNFKLKPSVFLSPLNIGESSKGEVQPLSYDEAGNVLAACEKVGDGTLYSIGTFIGAKYYQGAYADFENFVRKIVKLSGYTYEIKVEASKMIQWRTGISGNTRLMFLINTDDGINKVKVFIPGMCDIITDMRKGMAVPSIITDSKTEFEVEIDDGDYTVLCWQEP